MTGHSISETAKTVVRRNTEEVQKKEDSKSSKTKE